MRKFENGKRLIQIDDILILSKYDEENMPKSLIDKAYDVKHPLFKGDEKEYFEYDEQDEIKYINNNSYILNKNLFDIFSYAQLKEELTILQKRLSKALSIDLLLRDNAELELLRFKYTQLIDYLKERLNNSCETCINEDCLRTANEKMGLDKDGKPMGSNCKMYKNILQNIDRDKF